MNQCTQIPKTLKEIKITLPDYKNSNCNLSNSILKNFGIKPLITIKGDILITSGDGSIDDPYSLDESPKAKAGDYLNMRHTGEYITYSGYTWRIISTETDGTIKVIADDIINLPNDEEIGYTDSDTVKKYNPTKKGNVGYIINQRTSDTVDEKYIIIKNAYKILDKNLILTYWNTQKIN